MFWIYSIFENEYLQLFLSTTILLLIFYAVGRIIQNKFSFRKSNVYISIPLGLIAFLSINQIFYLPVILLGLDSEIFNIIDTLKIILILTLVIIFYETWIPKVSFNGLKILVMSAISILIAFSIYILFSIYLKEFNNIDFIWLNNISNIDSNNGVGYFFYSDANSNIEFVMKKYQSIYYWIFISSQSGDISLEKVMNFQITIIWLISISLIIQSEFINYERTIINYVLVTMTSLIPIIILGFVSPTSDIFYTISISLILWLILWNYLKRPLSSDFIVFIFLLGILSFTSAGTHPLNYLMIFGFLSIIVILLQKGNITKAIVHFLIVISSISLFIILALLTSNLISFPEAILYSFILGLLSLLFITPLFSLEYSNSRNNELSEFEKIITNKFFNITIIISIILTIFSLVIIVFVHNLLFVSELKSFFSELNLFGNVAWIGLLLYVVVILFPLLMSIIFFTLGYKNKFLQLFIIFNLILNPFVLISTSYILGYVFTADLIWLPVGLQLSSLFIEKLLGK